MASYDDEELEVLAARVGELVRNGLGPRSRWALRAALDAAETSGIDGVMSFQIHGKPSQMADVGFTIGNVEVVHRWGS